MYKVDRNSGGYITTSGKIAWPARHYWWEVVGYDVETDFITHSTTFLSLDLIVGRPRCLFGLEGGGVGPYVVETDFPPVVPSWPRNLSASGDASAIVAIYLVHCVLLGVGCWLLAHKHVLACDLDEGVGAGGSVHECAV